jgi:hypothetical protein
MRRSCRPLAAGVSRDAPAVRIARQKRRPNEPLNRLRRQVRPTAESPSAESRPVLERDARERVLIGYGEVMSIVQLWEQALAVVWWHTQRKHGSRPSGDFDTPRSQKQIARLEAAFLRMTAQAVREAVAPCLEPKTADDLGELMAERNRLAHRFLRERVADDRDFKAGTHDQLIALGDRFMGSLESVMRTIAAFESYRGPVLEHWSPLAERIMERVFSGQAIPRDPRLQ